MTAVSNSVLPEATPAAPATPSTPSTPATSTSRALGYASFALVIVGLICAFAAFTAHHEVSLYRERTEIATRNTAGLIANAVEGLFDKADVSLQTVGGRYREKLNRGRADRIDLDAMLRSHRRAQPELLSLRIADRNGNVIHGLGDDEQPMNLADGQFFKAAKASAPGTLVVTGPVLARIAKRWVLVLSRRVDDDRLGFLGVVYANIAVENFESLLRQPDLGAHGAATLRMQDLSLIYRAPKVTDAIGSKKVSTDLIAIFRSGRTEGTYAAATALDGIERFNSYKKVNGYPVFVIVGMAPSDLRSQAMSSLVLIGVLLVASLGAVGIAYGLVWRSTARLERDIALRRLSEAALLRTQDALNQAQKIARIGNWVYHIDAERVQWSDHLYKVLDFEPRGFEPRLNSLQPNFAAPDWDRLTQAVADCISGGSVCDMDFPVTTGSGKSIWVNVKCEVHRDAQGRAQRLDGTLQDITERKRLELAFESTNSELDDLYNHVPCGYYSLDVHGRYAKVNATMLDWIGYGRDEVLGKIGPGASFTAESQQRFNKSFPKFMAHGRIDEVEFELINRRTNERRLVSVTATAIYGADGHYEKSRSVMFDITELRNAQSRIAKILTEQQSILASQTVGVVKLKDRRAVWVNASTEQMFGYAVGELVGQSVRMLYPSDAAFDAVGQEAYPFLSENKSYRSQVQLQRKDGSLIWVDMQGATMDQEPGMTLWILSDISMIRNRQERLEFESLHDPLTGLANRVLLNGQMPQVLASARRMGKSAAVCFVDLDGFKPVNDSYGHAVGDVVLKEVARRLLESVRANDIVARVGGDEFILLLAHLDRADECTVVCERARTSLLQPIEVGALTVRVGMSLGIALYPSESTTPEDLIALADRRMYADKLARRKGL